MTITTNNNQLTSLFPSIASFLPQMTLVHKRQRLDQSHTFHISLDDLLLTQTSVAVIDKMSADGRRSLPQAYHVRQPTPPELFFNTFDFDHEPYDQDPPLETEVVSTEDSTVSSERDLRTRYVSSVRNKFCLSSAWTHLFSRTTRCLSGHLIGANILMSFIFSMVFGGSAPTGVPHAQFTPTKIHLFIAVKTVLSGSLYVACAACQPTCCTRCMWSRFFFCDAALLCLSYFFFQHWNKTFFERTSLKDLGLRVQLGHPIGSTCTNPRANAKSFFILHINGVHEVTVNFCDCDKKSDTGNWRVQCLRREWFPATQKNPETCFTFRVMEHFHLQTLQAKTTAHDYCIALAKLTDSTATFKLTVSTLFFWSPLFLNLYVGFLQSISSCHSTVAAS